LQNINKIKWFFSLEGRNARDNIILFCSKCSFAIQVILFYPSAGALGLQKLIETFNLPSSIIIKTRYGFLVRISRMYEYVLFTRLFEPEVLARLKISEKMTFIDVGANYGLYTLYMASKNPSCTIIAMEPYDKVYAALVDNVQLNSYDNVKCMNCAAWDVDNITINLYLNKESIANPTVVGSTNDFVPVHTRTIDGIVTEHGLSKINWLKIDVESAETFVLKGAKESLKITDNILLEIHTKENGVFCEEMLKKIGFRTEIIRQKDKGFYNIHAYK